MATNWGEQPWVVTNSTKVRLKREYHRSSTSSSWVGVGTVVGMEKDVVLTELNRKNLQVYRVNVDFGNGEVASLLPETLRRV